ncbi:putative transcription factor cys6 [Phaeomoniella chlamydospora]|uniref:Putative transcription factor cys6 n=1 Tax=Phaeomoniella chlamydospora TaxID=158046 RepID=A0A0G2EB66_PHACM|nr:putative transcription factor cys6 [Phaeomoniella chlamydospora]
MERRYMQYFQERAAVELSEYHDAPFWNKQVLQVSHLHPAVRHCLVAIASLHESLHQGQGLSASSLMNKEMTFSLQQYNKAINLLTVHWRHIRTTRSTNGSYFDEDVAASLDKIMQRLQYQYSTFIEAEDTVSSFIEPGPTSPDLLEDPNISPTFTDLYHARQNLDLALEWEFHAMQLLLSSTDTTARHKILSKITRNLRRWYTTFDTFLTQSRHRHDSNFQRASITVKIHATCAVILPYTLASNLETTFDRFTPQLDFIVAESQRFLSLDHRPHSQILFTFDLGIIPPLYLVACRSRDPRLRRRAISLLKLSNRREGVWDSNTASRLSERILAIEEQGMPNIHSCTDIPESHRIRLVATNAHPDNGKLELYYIRAPFDTKTCPVEKDCTIWDEDKAKTFKSSEKDEGDVRFWNSIYTATFSANGASQGLGKDVLREEKERKGSS